MNVNVVEIADAIRSFVATGPLPGSRLAGTLKSQFPEWNPADFGVRTLREFVSTLVPGVVVAGRSGMDVIYALEGTDVDTPGPPPPANGDYWRIWVSPNSPYAIAVDRAQLTLRAVPRAAHAESGSILLAPPSSEVHRSFARDFLATVSPEARARLGGLEADMQDLKKDLRGLKVQTIAEIYKANLTVASFADLGQRR